MLTGSAHGSFLTTNLTLGHFEIEKIEVVRLDANLYTIPESFLIYNFCFSMSIFWLVALIVALSIHEYAHARVADELGDPTPRLSGRLTLNPLAHIDLFGTIILPLVLILSKSPVVFGWGKPVPIDPYNLRHPRRDQALIALAGPVANFLTALLAALIFRFLPLYPWLPTIAAMSLGLGLFNLLPFGPLDGAKVFLGFVPPALAEEWESVLNQYGLIILFLLFFPLFGGVSLLSLTLGSLINFFLSLLFPSLGGKLI